MENFNDSLRNGWDKIFQKRLLNEQDEILSDDERAERLEDLKALHHHAKVKAGNDTAAYQDLKKSFNEFFLKRMAGTYSVGKSHFAFTNYQEINQVFLAPTDQKASLMHPGSNFDYDLFLNDYKELYDQNRASEGPQGAISQKPSDPKHRKPNTVYNQLDIQRIMNARMFPIIAVAMAGKEGLEALKAEKPEIFTDWAVQEFLDIKNAAATVRQDKAAEMKLVDKIKAFSTPVTGYKEPKAPVEEPASVEPTRAIKNGPGKVQQEEVIVEQTEHVVDVSNKNKKALNESWKAYQNKNKDVKNTERPDDLTMLLG